jgi:hypothetical protein
MPDKLKDKEHKNSEDVSQDNKSIEEIDGPNHDPIKYGDWQKNGRVSDF